MLGRPVTLSRYQASLLGLKADLRLRGRALRSSAQVVLWADGVCSSPTSSSLETACGADSSACNAGKWTASRSSRQYRSRPSCPMNCLTIDHAAMTILDLVRSQSRSCLVAWLC